MVNSLNVAVFHLFTLPSVICATQTGLSGLIFLGHACMDTLAPVVK